MECQTEHYAEHIMEECLRCVTSPGYNLVHQNRGFVAARSLAGYIYLILFDIYNNNMDLRTFYISTGGGANPTPGHATSKSTSAQAHHRIRRQIEIGS